MGFDVRHGHAVAGRAAIPEATHAEATPAQKASAAKNVADNIDRIQSSFAAAIHEMEECGTAGDRGGWLNGHRKATATLAQLGRLAASAPEAQGETPDPSVAGRLAESSSLLVSLQQQLERAPPQPANKAPQLSCEGDLLAALPPDEPVARTFEVHGQAEQALAGVLGGRMTFSDIEAFQTILRDHPEHPVARRYRRLGEDRQLRLQGILSTSKVRARARAREDDQRRSGRVGGQRARPEATAAAARADGTALDAPAEYVEQRATLDLHRDRRTDSVESSRGGTVPADPALAAARASGTALDAPARYEEERATLDPRRALASAPSPIAAKADPSAAAARASGAALDAPATYDDARGTLDAHRTTSEIARTIPGGGSIEPSGGAAPGTAVTLDAPPRYDEPRATLSIDQASGDAVHASSVSAEGDMIRTLAESVGADDPAAAQARVSALVDLFRAVPGELRGKLHARLVNPQRGDPLAVAFRTQLHSAARDRLLRTLLADEQPAPTTRLSADSPDRGASSDVAPSSHGPAGAVPSEPSDVEEPLAAEDTGSSADEVDHDEDDGDGETGANEGAPVEPASENAIAQGGIEGPGQPLPFAAQIQRSFGRHDIGSVKAHEGEASRDAAHRLGASAYAYGRDIAFGETPDLHTAAHEAAHTIQQHHGIARKSHVSESSAMEQHADRVADAVTRGVSAEPILDEVALPVAGQPVTASTTTAVVQRKGAKKKGKKTKQDLREDRPYHTDFTEISSAAHGDTGAMANLDIEWIDGLSPYIVEQIDREFHGKNVEAQFEKRLKGSKDVKALKKSLDADLKQLKKDAKARLKAAGIRSPKERQIAEDPDYDAATRARKQQYESDLAATRTEQRAAYDAEHVKPKAEMLAITPPEDGVTRLEGRVLARADFMSWGTETLGSPEAVKDHFNAIVEVPGTKGMYLHRAASDRYVAARAWFENEYPGYTFHTTDVAMQLRNRHQEGHPQGKMGHPLGLSIDFKAYDNPNQLGDGVAQYMLRRFGGEDEDTPGQNMVKTDGNPFTMTEEIGEATISGQTLTKKQVKFLDSVEKGFNDMAATSRRFQESLQDEMPELREAESLWLEQGVPAAAKYRKTQDKLEKEIKAAEKHHRKEMKGLGDEERQAIVDSDPKVVAAQEAFDTAETAFLLIKDQVTATMQSVFAPWTTPLQSEIDEKRATIDERHLTLDVDVAAVDKVLDKLKGIKKQKQVADLLKRNAKVFANLDASMVPDDLEEARELLEGYLKDVRAAKWVAGEIGVKEELVRRLTESPWAVFGTESTTEKGTGRTKHKPTVSNVTVMQYLENGFVRDDAMPDKPGAKVGGKGADHVFNAKFVRCMAMFGFNTLATWSGVDTMHFDFREGFNAIKKHEQYSP